MADLSSILGGMVQGFKDFGTGLVDMFGTGGAAIGDAITSIQTGRATTKNQDDFRKWLYNTDSTKDAAARGLGTILNGVSTVADVIPGAQAVTANPLFNGLQGAIGGVSDELKMAGENADLGRAAQRAGVGAASGLASGYAGQGLAKTGNKLLSNGLTRGAVSGALGGGIANAGYTGIEGGSVQDMINAGLYGAQTGALVGGTTGLARELIKPTHKMDVSLTDDEKAARIANIDDQLGKLDLNTPEGNARYNELMNARNNYADNRKAQFELLQKTNPMTDDYHTGIRSPEEIYTLKNIVDSYNQDNNFTYPDFTLADAQKALASGNINVYGSKPIEPGAFASPSKMMATDYAGGGEVYTKNIPLEDFAFIESGDEGNYLPVGKPKTVADLMNEPKQKTVADLMLSPEQKEFFKDSVIRDENGNLKKMYHGTPEGDFKKFREGSFFTDDKDYADTYQDEYAGITQAGKKGANPKTYEVYLDVKKPFSMADPEARRIINDEYIKRDRGYWVGDVDNTEVDFTEADNLRKWLQKNHPEYDGMYVNEGGGDDPFAGDGWEEWRGNSVVPFNANQIKDVNNLLPTIDDDIMAAKVAPGQMDLFSQPKQKTTTKQKAATVDEQLDLFSQPKPVEPENPYAPVDGKVTDKMRARADMLTKTTDIPARNELYSKIDPETMPKTGIDVIAAEAEGIKGQKAKRDYITKKYLGVDKADDMTLDQAAEVYYDMFPTDKQEFIGQVKRIVDSPFYGDNVKEQILENSRKALIKRLKTRVNKAADATTKRGGYAGAADAALSERLGIAPGNTNKRTAAYDDKSSAGRYRTGARELAVKEQFDPENAVSTVAHERLHSFQAESKPEILGRYSDEVKQAYNELSRDLKQFRHTQREIAKRYGYKTKYWSTPDEQEARMFQQYLQNKGYADAPQVKNGSRANEWGDEINPAFDKFIDKLRDLSKRGIALPAITALFGGGAIMAATQGDDKKKKSEVK